MSDLLHQLEALRHDPRCRVHPEQGAEAAIVSNIIHSVMHPYF